LFWQQLEKGREKGNSILACVTVVSPGRIAARGTEEEDETGCRSKEIQACTAAISHEVESHVATSLFVLMGTL